MFDGLFTEEEGGIGFSVSVEDADEDVAVFEGSLEGIGLGEEGVEELLGGDFLIEDGSEEFLVFFDGFAELFFVDEHDPYCVGFWGEDCAQDEVFGGEEVLVFFPCRPLFFDEVVVGCLFVQWDVGLDAVACRDGFITEKGVGKAL